jgi:recombination protein RecT
MPPSKPKPPATQEQNKPATIRDWLQSAAVKKQFEAALPKVCTADRFIRVALTALNKNPKLLGCTRESVLQCLYDLAELGLEPDGRLAHLVPYGTKCGRIIDYKGKVELAYRSGRVSNIHADKVCENDTFEWNLGLITKHIIDWKNAKKRGKPYAYYAIIRMKNGTEKHEVMDMEELSAIRQRSKSPNTGPWVTDEAEMNKKSVFHRGSKWIPQSPELRRAEQMEEEEFLGKTPPPNPALANIISGPIEKAPPAEDAEGMASAATGQAGPGASTEPELPLGDK